MQARMLKGNSSICFIPVFYKSFTLHHKESLKTTRHLQVPASSGVWLFTELVPAPLRADYRVSRQEPENKDDPAQSVEEKLSCPVILHCPCRCQVSDFR